MEEDKEKILKIVEDSIKPKLEQARMDGIMIGWTTCCRRMYNDTKNLHSVKAVRKYLKDYAETIEKKMSEQVADDKQ